MGKRFVFPSLLIVSVSAWGQWYAGAGLVATYKPPVQLVGAAHVGHPLSLRTSITAEVNSNIPHWARSSGFHAGSPRQLAAGDTGSYNFEAAQRTTRASALLGLRGIFGPTRRTRHWYWAISTGYGVAHTRYKGTHTFSYTDNQFKYDEQVSKQFILGSVAIGSIWRLKLVDLLAGVGCSRWFPFPDKRNKLYGTHGHYLPAAQVAVLWRWGH
ncbi:MAG TPA: hypothetical protein PLV70_00230 [Flavobacteriales bacterium]|nr:hypothetical protein [Flavobacteriales bacterium]HRP80344.1 hypothetical protein [Flavobacteriales bacterium]HRQ83519.1 hypothetical protein [Flavobacteriales bacterium]